MAAKVQSRVYFGTKMQTNISRFVFEKMESFLQSGWCLYNKWTLLIFGQWEQLRS